MKNNKAKIEKARKEAEKVLRHCGNKIGFYASGLPGGYEALWARDSIITSLGLVAVSQDNDFKKYFKRSIDTLSKNRSDLGQIPNAVGTYNKDRRSDVTFNTVDSNLWYLIGVKIYLDLYGDKKEKKKYKNSTEKALTWLKHRDTDEVGFITQLPTMDWQDAFPHKYGYTINSHALYYGALKMYGKSKEAEEIKKIANGLKRKYMSLYDSKKEYYLPWIWKNHDTEREGEDWFDTLGNLLAIVTGLANRNIARRILKHIDNKKINRPHPCKSIWPPIKKGDKEWHSYFSDAASRKPYYYLNAGAWPFIGGFYVAALVKIGFYKKAEKELEKLAEANEKGLERKWEFREWLDGKNGKIYEDISTPYQGWSAGMFLFAYECVESKNVPFFK